MLDQATQLRKLVLQSARMNAIQTEPAPRLVVMTGSKLNVGVTTLAVRLATALAEQGSRVVLVDADLQRADVAPLCGIAEQRNVVDVLTSRSDIHEVLVRGPAGVLVVPGVGSASAAQAFTESSQLRLLKQFRKLGRYADVILLDVGSDTNEVVRRYWQAADDVVVVTTPDPVALMDGYATIKKLSSDEPNESLHVVVNRAANGDAANDVHVRIDQSCRRFLGHVVRYLGWVPDDAALGLPHSARQTGQAPSPLVAHPSLSEIATRLLTDRFVPSLGLAVRSAGTASSAQHTDIPRSSH